MKFKSIAFFPISTYDLGSSRIRVGNIVKELKKKSIKVYEYVPKNKFHYLLRYLNIFKHNIIIFQKTNDLFSIIAALFTRITKKIIIFDIDDNYYDKFKLDCGNTNIASLRIMVKTMTFLAHYVTVDSERLANVVYRYNKNTIILPTNINVEQHKQKKNYSIKNKVIIGWMGSGATHSKNLKLLVKPLEFLSKKHTIELKIVGAQGNKKLYQMFNQIKGLKTNFIDNIGWDSQEEVSKQLLSFDIAVSPMENTDYNNAKSQYKVIVYLASSLPVVISPVGDGDEIINDGKNGFLASSEEEWIKKLKILIKSKKKREKLGENGRKSVEKYSLKKVIEKYMNFFNRI